MGVPARKGRERASREAIDSENGVIRCANTASPPPSPPPVSTAEIPWRSRGASREIEGGSEESLPAQPRELASPLLDLSGAELGRDLLVSTTEANHIADRALRDPELARELSLGLQGLTQRSPDEKANVPGENDLDLPVGQRAGSPDRALHDRLP